MHRCLQIPEIVHLIIQVLSLSPKAITKHASYASESGEDDQKVNDKALLSLSLVSKFFLEPCLDALWGCMESAEPLLKLMLPPDRRPAKQNASATSISYSDMMNLAQAIDEAYKTRVHYYADRIRGIMVGYGDIDEPMDRALSVWLSTHNAPLLPNLNYLHWEEDTIGLYPCLMAFSGPKVTTLKLTLDIWPEECEGLLYSVFSSFRAACPLLTVLEVEDVNGGMSDGSGEQLSFIFSAFPTITRAGFWIAPSIDTLLFLATMPKLHTMINRLYPYPGLVRLESNLPILQFPALQVLRWSVVEFKDAIILLSRLQPGIRDIQGIAIRCDNGNFDTSEIIKFFDAIHATCSPQTLTSLSLQATDDPENNGSHVQPHQASASTPGGDSSLVLLRSLRYFSHIKEFSIAKLPMVLDNQLINEVCKAWPLLRHLELVAKLLPGESRISVAGLRTIANHCHFLEYLAVEVGSWLDDESHSSNAPTCDALNNRTRVVEIYYHDSPVRDAESDRRCSAGIQSVQHLFPHAQISLSRRSNNHPGYNSSEGIIIDLV